MEEFYKKQDKEAEEREKKVIALLENAIKAYRERLALFDGNNTFEQVRKGSIKIQKQKPKEYELFKYAIKLLENSPVQNSPKQNWHVQCWPVQNSPVQYWTMDDPSLVDWPRRNPIL
ncbi:30S ribosomal protein S20 domain protein [Ancylostoma caninum]|uniref:30S ribosomal protein S20 domain protein n=1 Tax=Ancylostoma caninum TaxID=29170 RepID=A0A368H8J3_ANCCA|nr:30S ribosomal protein S20 domain protein [Ancylostoma caninum]